MSLSELRKRLSVGALTRMREHAQEERRHIATSGLKPWSVRPELTLDELEALCDVLQAAPALVSAARRRLGNHDDDEWRRRIERVRAALECLDGGAS